MQMRELPVVLEALTECERHLPSPCLTERIRPDRESDIAGNGFLLMKNSILPLFLDKSKPNDERNYQVDLDFLLLSSPKTQVRALSVVHEPYKGTSLIRHSPPS